MKADICVDYLSHEWHSSDTIQAYREIQNQLSKLSFDTITKKHSYRDFKKITNEKNQLIRFQNAIWRQMTKTCTTHLGSNNQMIHPSLVNWQKESDITWLYGPLYLPCTLMYDQPSILEESTMKLASTKAECIRQLFKLSNSKRYWSKCVSESGKQTELLSVRFDPDITKVEYLPESPVNESIPPLLPDFNIIDDEDEDDEDDEILKALIFIGSYIKQFILTTLFGRLRKEQQELQQKQQQAVIISQQQRDLTRFCISIVSFAAWLIYQTVIVFSSTLNRTLGVSNQIKAKNC